MGGLLLVMLLVAPASARAEEGPARWRVEAGIERIAWLGSVAWNGGRAQALAAHWRLPDELPLELGLAARLFQAELVLPEDSFELGVDFSYAPVAGRHYRPSIGLEAGYSGAMRIDWKGYFGEGWQEQDPVGRADYRPWYLGLVAEPVRFCFGPIMASTMGFSIDSLAGGRVVRARASLLQAGVQW